MPSCEGIGMVTIWTLTFFSRSTIGIRNVIPGWRGLGLARPKRNTMPRSTWLTTRTPPSTTTPTAAPNALSSTASIITASRAKADGSHPVEGHTDLVVTIPGALVADAGVAARAAADRHDLRVVELDTVDQH